MDEQPPSRPDRPPPQATRRRPAGRSRSATSTGARPPGRRARPPAPPQRPPVEEEDGGSAPGPNRSQKKLVVLLSVLTVVVIGVAALAFTAGDKSSDDLPPPAPADTPIPLTNFKDPETGISVEYPRAWQRMQVPVADYRLVLDGGNNVGMTIRVEPIQTPATAANLENFKAFTDGAVALNPTVNILKQQAISLNGMLGYYYFYTFTDGGAPLVHAHYFLFSGHKMNILVFQSLPDDFEGLAPTFDKIAESFRSDPNVPSSAATSPTPTTTATTVP